MQRPHGCMLVSSTPGTTCDGLQSKWPRPAIIAFFDRD
ncbi:Unknown protein sequence [Pseudomonas amygdali pv. lachrymans]|uniref:Uncharacterized protein n=1 Tax=Pseudomonas amygdali pv. lachrymans TaxID=53707 RepID=A0ABR5L0U6_PSEAV|nr:Unknown protein sequence [Pseudomonas syringae pv. maculicola]KPC03421.1 Unknown protein sequence [Pseudomonas amygdali pv. lachrymans]KPC21799.1 Unknown protein sequence [Pseudomonas amygdali pv. lachrymans]